MWCTRHGQDIATRLAKLTGYDLLQIDQERKDGGGWPTLLAKLELARHPTIVESVVLPARYRQLLAAHGATIIHVTCDETTRRERLAARGDTDWANHPPLPIRYARMTADTTHTDPTPAIAKAIQDGRLKPNACPHRPRNRPRGG